MFFALFCAARARANYFANSCKYDRYKVYKPNSGVILDSAPDDTATTANSSWTAFGSDRLKECIMQRRLEERQAPPDEHEEITRYLKDAIVDLSNWPSVFHWWKVLLCFTCKHHK